VRDRFSHLIRDRIVDHADPGNQLPWEEGVHQEFGKTPAAAIIVFDRVPDARQQTILTRCRRVYVGAQELGFVSHLFQINTKNRSFASLPVEWRSTSRECQPGTMDVNR
jgi:hypothetical protein